MSTIKILKEFDENELVIIAIPHQLPPYVETGYTKEALEVAESLGFDEEIYRNDDERLGKQDIYKLSEVPAMYIAAGWELSDDKDDNDEEIIIANFLTHEVTCIYSRDNYSKPIDDCNCYHAFSSTGEAIAHLADDSIRYHNCDKAKCILERYLIDFGYIEVQES